MFRIIFMLMGLCGFIALAQFHLNPQVRAQGQTFIISGRVTQPPSATGVGIDAVTMTLTLNTTNQRITQTDSGGNFSFADVATGSNYELVPSKPGYVFSPQTQGGTNLGSDRTLFFTGNQSNTGSISLSNSALTVAENATAIVVTVNRTGNTGNEATVDYTTSDTAGAALCNSGSGAASSRCDYLMTLGSLTFLPGETSKAISIPIINDVYVEGNETFTITLTSSTGATLAPPVSAIVTIVDEDNAGGSANPIDDAAFFVRQHYLDFLNREPDQGGLDFWTNQITSCGGDTQCRDAKRTNVSAAFFLSIEFQETGFLVYRVYKSANGNVAGKPVPANLVQFLKDTQRIGQNVRVGIGDWEAQLEANKQSYILAFVQRFEFLLAYPNSMTADEIVSRMDLNTGGVLTANERSNLVALLTPDPTDITRRATALRSIADNAQLRSAEFNKAFVLMQYFGYMRRNPDDQPDSDFSGFNFWLGKLNSFGGNFVDAEMVKAFIVSGEFRQRFGP